MKALWSIFLGGLVLVGKAEARLGESYETIRSRVGDLKLSADHDYPLELVEAKCMDVAGFSTITFVFFRTKGGSDSQITISDISGNCVGVYYGKYYKKWNEVEMAPKDVGELLAKNFPDPATSMQIVKSDGISGDIATSRLWNVRWIGAHGEYAEGGVRASSEYTPTFYVVCWSAELKKFNDNKYEEEKRAKEQKRQKAMDAL